MKNRDCGSCVYFTKLKNMVGDGGICESYDSRTTTDSGRTCKIFKRMKFHRDYTRQSIRSS